MVRSANSALPPVASPGADLDLAEAQLDGIIAAHVQRVLGAVGGNKSKAAEALGIPRTSLYHKIRKYGIGVDRD
jgi:transcriptional regulator of acetoin/glycerol metabolism